MQGLSTGTIAQLMQGLPAAPPYFYQIMGACALQPAPSREAQRSGCDSLRPSVYARRHEGGGIQRAERQCRAGKALQVRAD